MPSRRIFLGPILPKALYQCTILGHSKICRVIVCIEIIYFSTPLQNYQRLTAGTLLRCPAGSLYLSWVSGCISPIYGTYNLLIQGWNNPFTSIYYKYQQDIPGSDVVIDRSFYRGSLKFKTRGPSRKPTRKPRKTEVIIHIYHPKPCTKNFTKNYPSSKIYLSQHFAAKNFDWPPPQTKWVPNFISK